MSDTSTPTRFRLLKDYRPKAGRQMVDVHELRQRLSVLPGFAEVELESSTPSTVIVTVPARNNRESEKLRQTVNESLEGWRAIEDQVYSVPKTF